jgi:hypothetical protein
VKKIVALLLLAAWTTGFSQTLSFKFGIPFGRADLDVRWNAPTNTIPTNVWVYRLSPNEFSPKAVDYLRSLGPFSDADKKRSKTKEMLFVKPGTLPNLFVSFRLGQIRYQTATRPVTNLAAHVPPMAQLPELTAGFLKTVGIDVSQLTRKPDGTTDFALSEPSTEYYVEDKVITNVEFRAVSFRRAVDGAPWVGAETGGDGQVQFGDYGIPRRIWLSWRNLERSKSFSTADSKIIIDRIRLGKAVQNMIPMNAEPIDWSTVKSLTVNGAKLCYYAGGPFAPSDWLMPFAALWTTVDTGHGKIDVEIDCPIID